MKSTNDLLLEHLIWSRDESRKCYYSTDAYDKSICWLRMNDFPEEPLWTLHFNGHEVDFDDEPENWKINYDLLLEGS